jgi:hypothetical protein
MRDLLTGKLSLPLETRKRDASMEGSQSVGLVGRIFISGEAHSYTDRFPPSCVHPSLTYSPRQQGNIYGLPSDDTMQPFTYFNFGPAYTTAAGSHVTHRA